MKTLVAVAVLALLAITLPANAQGPNPNGIVLTATSAGTVPYMGSGSFAFTLDVGCAELSAPSSDFVVALIGAPTWLNATPKTVTISAAGCVGVTGRVSEDDSLAFTVLMSAPAVVQHTVNLKATQASKASNEAAATYTVAYESDFSLTPSVQFPLTVTNKTTTFTVVGQQASNAPSMIMVDDFSASAGALVSGIGALQYANVAGKPENKTYTVIFTAPSGAWENATVTLKVYGHYNFDGMAGDPMDNQTITWQFVNGGVPAGKNAGGGKDTPAPAGALTVLGLLAFAGLLRRKA